MTLATVEQVAARLGRVIDVQEQPRVQAFIDDVSAMVRDYCGTDFQFHRDQAVPLEPTPDLSIHLPYWARPVAGISSVRWDDGTAVDGWVYRQGSLWRSEGWRHAVQPLASVVVTASYGYPAVPGTVTAAVCAEVIRWLAVQPGVERERVGDLEVTYGATAPTQGLSPATREALRRYRRSVISRDVWRAGHAL
ncbi:hypothetical protein GCM10020221_11320 [Streptomyces thioluteus]|uniref:Phage gp6-like head-tail connector protein n=1 Tax=Streptomyces thioluteus TaxID=66431 RepID=A0ABN3WIW9_STRTU